MPNEHTFTARIDLIGLFRFWPDKGPDGKGEINRIVGLAPWTGPGARDEKRDEGFRPDPLHHLVAMWWPRSQYTRVPPSAMTLWPLGGMELTFDYATSKDSDLDVDLEQIRLPIMTRNSAAGGADAIVPQSLGNLAELDQERCLKPVGTFRPDKGGASRYTDHLGIQKNMEGVMGRVLIDRGNVRTDDLTSQESHLSPSLWNDGLYSGYFTNRINVIVRKTSKVVMRARNLITKNLAGEVELTTDDRELLIQVMHLCPEQLLTECPDLPKDGKNGSRDEDFHRLYDLSIKPLEIKNAMRKLRYNKNKPPDELREPTVPVSYFDGHTCQHTRCGSCVG